MIGAALGVGGATMVARINSALFSGARPFDAPVLLAAVALLGVLALGASYLPARRIADEDAAATLRSE